jgi:site-specific DNA-methyltransferase (adenine-specific)
MKPYYEKDDITLYCGDNREVLPTLSEASVDFVCSDPPYGLGFMGHEWDHGVPGIPYWEAIQRVCKPGALMLAFGGTRTYHRLTCAIEDAGWEIRDCLMWLYGTGFPKAADIGKTIDKAKGASREVIGTKLGRPGYSLADNGRTNEVYGDLHNPVGECAITAPATDLAKQWTGWANALKPAWEPIVLAMKPLDGTLAHNAETWGVAGMNIDGSRIQTADNANGADHKGKVAAGRWPANILLDEETATQLDQQSGQSASKVRIEKNFGRKDESQYRIKPVPGVVKDFGDAGGASRFFYTAKASRSERGEGNDHPTVKPLKLMQYLLTLLSTPTGGRVLDPFAGSGSTLLAAKLLGRRAMGIELEEHFCEIAASRLDSL